jgi:hypothetical protein
MQPNCFWLEVTDRLKPYLCNAFGWAGWAVDLEPPHNAAQLFFINMSSQSAQFLSTIHPPSAQTLNLNPRK